MTERRLLLATGNPGKVREIRQALAGLAPCGERLEVVGLADVLPGLAHAERGRTFQENARAKSLFYSRRWPGLTLAEDSGLEIDALGGAPGVRSARFSAPRPSDEKNNRKVLRLLARVPAAARKARFVCVMVLAVRGRIVAEFRGEVRGRIERAPRGASGFGYDPLFYCPPLRKTFGELAPALKNRVSHRGRAAAKLRRFLEAARDIASQFPVAEGGTAQRGEPHELVPGAGELEAMPEHSRREGLPGIRRRAKKKAPSGGRPDRASALTSARSRRPR